MLINKPNLIIAGFPKSGTSSLFKYLAQHPNIYGSGIKEPHTYSIDKRYKNRFSDAESLGFKSLYGEAKGEYILDASTTYMISENAIKRIKEDTPNAKIVLIARDPIERVFSHFNWIRTFGIKTKSFRDEIIEWDKREFDANFNFKGNYKNYLEFSRYGKQIERCFKYFSVENVKILSTYELKHNYQKTLIDILKFLNIQDNFIFTEVITNKTIEESIIDKNYPSIYKRIVRKIDRLSNKKINLEKTFIKKIKLNKIAFDENDERFIYKLLETDVKTLKNMNLLSPHWKIVNKYYSENA